MHGRCNGDLVVNERAAKRRSRRRGKRLGQEEARRGWRFGRRSKRVSRPLGKAAFLLETLPSRPGKGAASV